MCREITHIIIHCSATGPTFDVTAAQVDAWHLRRGWSGIGYHYFIRRNGLIEPGRMLKTMGAHARGFNAHSIGVCYAGGVDADGHPEDNRTSEQRQSLLQLIQQLRRAWPQAVVCGHCELPGVKKACPSFDVASWLKTEGLS